MDMDEQSLISSIDTYKTQLGQINNALEAAGEDGNDDLLSLRQDLQDIIALTEESLLSLKKSQLLSQLEQSIISEPARQQPNDSSFNDEFAAFKAALDDESNENDDDGTVASSMSIECKTNLDQNDEDLSEIVGTKCRAPYHQEWGGFQYHNCMIVDLEISADVPDPKVRVMFCQPTQLSMVPCPYYLEDRCRFGPESCRFSHGYLVNVDQLREYEDPDYSKLWIDADCLAKDSDGVWYKAKVIEEQGEGHTFQIMFDSNNQTATVEAEDIIPYGYVGDESDIEDDMDTPDTKQLISDEESNYDELPVFLWRPGQSTSCMGEWEAHTKGIGSRLMSKMGYITGQGLGRDKQGRTEPVPIQLLPQGKSLDKIMELKSLAGDQDLYDVMKRQKRKQRKVEQKAAEGYDKVISKSSAFDFINKHLGHHKGDIHSLGKVHPAKASSKVQHISEKQLHDRSDHQLNVQMLRTDEAITQTQKEVARFKAAIEKHKREPAVVAQYRKKLTDAERHLAQLQSSHTTIKSHKQSRSDNKKLTVF